MNARLMRLVRMALDAGAGAAGGEGGGGGAPSTPPAEGGAGATNGEGTTPPANPATDGGTPPGDAGKAPPSFQLSAPEGSALTADQLTRIAAIASERGLTQEAAQQALPALEQILTAEREAAEAAAVAAYQPGGEKWQQQVEDWKAQALSDPSLGKTEDERVAAIQRGSQVLQRYAQAHPERKAEIDSFLNDSGLGNHPAVVGLFAWLGKATREGSLVTPTAEGTPPREVTAADLYPTMQKS